MLTFLVTLTLFAQSALCAPLLFFRRPIAPQEPVIKQSVVTIPKSHVQAFQMLLQTAGHSGRVLIIGDQFALVRAIYDRNLTIYWIRVAGALAHCPLMELPMAAIVLPEEIEQTAALARALFHTLEYDGLLFVPEATAEFDVLLREHNLVRTGILFRRFLSEDGEHFTVYKRVKNGASNHHHGPQGEHEVFNGSRPRGEVLLQESA